MTALDVIRNLCDVVKLREDEGYNKDLHGLIASMNAEVGAEPTASYCASTVSHCFRKAGAGKAFPYSASSQSIKRSFKDKGLLFTDPDHLKALGGALGGWTDLDNAWAGHIFFIELRLVDSQGKVVAVGTVEGNTDGSGGREGDGVYRKKRVRKDDGLWYPVDENNKVCGPGHQIWFCDTTAITGGSWWDIISAKITPHP